MSEFLVAKNLVREYPEGDKTLRVLKGVSLDVGDGEFVVIVGASGAGKSTLLHLLGLLDTPTSGQVRFEGRDLTALSAFQKSRLRNELFGFVFQFFHLLPDFTAMENVTMPAMVGTGALEWRRAKRETRERAERLLGRVGLKERLTHRPAELSGGERQRVAICRALITRPRVLLLDEPTGNLDSKTGGEIHELVHDLNESSGQTVVMVTHDESEAKRTGRIVRLHDGQIVDDKGGRKR